jgi:DNA-binding Xre family transcriptional regulator
LPIREAVRDLIRARGLRPAGAAARLGGKRNRATLYRLLSGDTADPRISTLLAICTVLATGPNDVLQRAGLVPYRERSRDPIDVELRRAFGELRGLSEDDRRLCLAMLRVVIDPGARCAGRPRRPRRPGASHPS